MSRLINVRDPGMLVVGYECVDFYNNSYVNGEDMQNKYLSVEYRYSINDI